VVANHGLCHHTLQAGLGWNSGLEQALWLPEYDRPLGAPVGEAVEVAPHTYERSFAHAYGISFCSGQNSVLEDVYCTT
jgi:hypothetical protein